MYNSPSDTSDTVGDTSCTDESVRINHNTAQRRSIVNDEGATLNIMWYIQLDNITRLNVRGKPACQRLIFHLFERTYII